MIPRPATGRSVGGLAAMIAGMMKAERPPEASASAPSSAAPFVVPRVITAAAFLTLVAASKQAEKDEVIAAKAQAKLDHERRIKVRLQEHVDTQAWTKLLEGAQAAATRGEKSFELIRFLVTSVATKVARSASPRPTGLQPSGAKRPNSVRGGTVNCGRSGSGLLPKLRTILTEFRTTWRCC